MSALPPLGGVDAAAASRETASISDAAARLKSGQPAGKAAEAAQQFESVFLSQLFSMMFSGVGTDDLFGGGAGEKMWRGFLIDHIADAYAERGGLGIASAVTAQIIEMSEPTE